MKKLYIFGIALAVLLVSLTALPLAVPSVAEAYAGNCYAYASKKCVSNVAYWYDSCGSIQAVAQNCNTTNQVCSNGTCVGGEGTNYPVQTYIQNYRTACYNNNVFWYDSNSVVQSMQKSCSDTNSCTIDTCTSGTCKNTLRCDGSTCGVNSADYMAYCLPAQAGQGGAVGTTTVSQVSGVQTQSGTMAVSIFGKKESEAVTWSKSINAANGEKLNFIVIFKNISSMQADNVTLQANLTNNIAYTGNLKIDNVTSAGSVVSGINMGTLPAQSSKAVSFTGTLQSQNVQSIQVSANVVSGAMQDSDYLTINVPAGSAAAAAVSGGGFVNFIKEWYLWAIIIIVLIILFAIIFRRLSTSA